MNAIFFSRKSDTRRGFWGAWWCVPLIQALGSQSSVSLHERQLGLYSTYQDSQDYFQWHCLLKKMFHSVLNIYFCNLPYYLSAMATWFLKYLMYFLRAKNSQIRLWSFCEIVEMEILLSIGICKKWRVRFPKVTLIAGISRKQIGNY